MGDPERNMGLTTTCKVGVDLETITVLFQSTVTSFGLLTDCASMDPEKSVVTMRSRHTAFPAPEDALSRGMNGLIKRFSAIVPCTMRWTGCLARCRTLCCRPPKAASPE